MNAVLERFERHKTVIQEELLHVVPTFGKNLLQFHTLLYEVGEMETVAVGNG